MAVKRYRQGLAPLLLVSGGAVHPKRTPYNEALEMKKELMNVYGIPARAIIVEPHARHTTTNFRNAARLVYRYGIPADKKVRFCLFIYSDILYLPDFSEDQTASSDSSIGAMGSSAS